MEGVLCPSEGEGKKILKEQTEEKFPSNFLCS